jgi:hypothetical protein
MRVKIIEALKKIKELKRKSDELKVKVREHCAGLDCDTPTYADQRGQIKEWLQSNHDIVKEIGHLRTSIQRTNLDTKVTIELGGKFVTKCIAEWIDRRRELAKMEEGLWLQLYDKGLNEKYEHKLTPQAPVTTIKRVLYFDPKERDTKIELYRSEPALIDATLEITNAVTELKEA